MNLFILVKKKKKKQENPFFIVPRKRDVFPWPKINFLPQTMHLS